MSVEVTNLSELHTVFFAVLTKQAYRFLRFAKVETANPPIPVVIQKNVAIALEVAFHNARRINVRCDDGPYNVQPKLFLFGEDAFSLSMPPRYFYLRFTIIRVRRWHSGNFQPFFNLLS